MSTPLTTAIQNLTASANATTGASDTTLSAAVSTLIAGYVGGGEYYEGAYEVTPDFNGTELQTENKVMRDNVTVNPIQVETVSNPSGGYTVYIGGIV